MEENAPLNEELEKEYEERKVLYECGLRAVRTHIENARNIMETGEERNVYGTIEARIKSFSSIMEKCDRKGYDSKDIQSIIDHVHDIAGIRIVTLFEDDCYRICEAIKSHPEIEVREEKDYIKEPKDNGYRSLHLIVASRIYYKGQTKSVPVEIQIRTKAMDLWASVEHYCFYKKGSPSTEAPEMFSKIAKILDKFDNEAIRLRDFGEK